MIEPKELRLGNYIKFPHTKKQNGLLEYWNLVIYSIESRFARVSFLDDTRLMSISYNNLFPIPLTEEWLRRLGFTNEVGLEWNIGEDEEICIIEYFSYTQAYHYTAGHGTRSGIGCKYVHQLQNLYFALTGEELTTLKERP